MRIALTRFMNDESGATAIEYGLIAAGIAVAILVAVNSVGSSLTTLFRRLFGGDLTGWNQSGSGKIYPSGHWRGSPTTPPVSQRPCCKRE